MNRREFLKIGAISAGFLALGGTGGYLLGRSESQTPSLLESPPLVESGFEEKTLRKLKYRFLKLSKKMQGDDNGKFPSWAYQETGGYVSNTPNWSDALFVGGLNLFSNENHDFFNPLVKFYADLIISDGGAYKKLLEVDKSPDVAWTSFLTLVPVFETTKDEKYKKLALKAAEFVAYSLYDEGLGLFSTSENSGQYVVNSLLTITPLLFWAEKNEEDPIKAKNYGDLARKYIYSSINNFMRPDGSVFHAITKTKDGIIKGETKNPTGYNDNSTSTKILSTFILGVINGYKEDLSNQYFLETALKSFSFALKNTPKKESIHFDIGQIPNDLKKYKDTAGQSAIAYATLCLAELVKDDSIKTYLLNYGRFLIKDVVENHMTTYGGVANAMQGYWSIRDLKEGKTNIPIQIETINGNYWAIKALKKSKELSEA